MALKVILGIDNVVFISILAGRLLKEQQKKLRRLGLILAATLRIELLLIVPVILKLKNDLFTVFNIGF